MKAQDTYLTQLIEGAKQFIVPIFQRNYNWEITHCEQLWKDIIRIGSSDILKNHFIGSVVYIPDTNVNANISCWQIIDGQQRITTIILLLLALRNKLKTTNLTIPVSFDEIDDYYLFNRHGRGDLRYKILLTLNDRNYLMDLLDGNAIPDENTSRIVENFKYFTELIANADLNIVYTGIKKLMIVDVSLQQGIDNPQMIFESMNSTGKALNQADLIRNFILMGLTHDEQVELYNNFWHPMENLFGSEKYNDYFDEFMRFFLIIHKQDYRIKKNEVYDEFKNYYLTNNQGNEILNSLLVFSRYYCNIAFGKEEDRDLSRVFKDLTELRVDVAYPFLMKVYDDYSHEITNKDEFIKITLLVESYVFRRAVCDIPTNSLRQTFASLIKKINNECYLESIQAELLLMQSYRRFPLDNEFRSKIKEKNLYEFSRRSYWLKRMENFERKELVQVNEYTIEHIMPQNKNLRKEWKDELGDNWDNIHEQYLHTLGNLTLTAYNSEFSDRPFSEKRDMPGGFKESPLILNKGLGNCEKWDDIAMINRADILSEKACSVWKAPSLSEDILSKYTEQFTPSTYSIDNYTFLSEPSLKRLYDNLKEKILALDPCIAVDYLKHYIAFKAETNFVDVIPQSGKLKLSLNIDFPRIDDPQKKCKNVADKGHLGNGNTEIIVKEGDDLSYVIGLIRQALELQLDEENTDI